MRKKLLAGVMALALCSTNMLPQTIFAGEFTSGTLEEISETESSEIFTDDTVDSQETVSDENISLFNSEEIPEFDDEISVEAATDEGIKDIDITTGSCTINSSGSYRITSNGIQTKNNITLENITTGPINIYLNNVNIVNPKGPALQIKDTVNIDVDIYLENNNILSTTNTKSAGLQKDTSHFFKLNIHNNTSNNSSTPGTLSASANKGAGIGGAYNKPCLQVRIYSGTIKASSIDGAGIGGGYEGNASGIYIEGGSITASSQNGAGIGGGFNTSGTGGQGNNISISGGSIKASSKNGAGIGGGYGNINIGGSATNINISGGSVIASSTNSAGIGGGYCRTSRYSGGAATNFSITGGIITASCSNTKGFDIGSGINGNNIPGSNSNICISGGSVKAKINSPTNKNGALLYCCSIPYESNSSVWIDDAYQWENPNNHSALDPNDTNLYAWLTGEDHIVTIGDKRRSYIFNSDSKSFTQGKRTATGNDFVFTLPTTNFTYDGQPKSVTVSPKSGIKGMGSIIKVNYFLEDNLINGLPVNAGTYTVKINIDEGNFYNSRDNLTDDNWKFTIEPAPITSDIQITSYSGTYDGGPHAVIYSVTGCPKGCTIKYSTDRKTWTDKCPTVKSVEDATNTSVYIQISKENYTTLTLGPQKASISPKDITINIDNLEKTYGTANPALTFKVSDQTPLVANDTIKSLGIKLKTTAETSSPVNSSGYPITLESWTNKNYNVTANQEGALKVKLAAKAPNLPSDIDTKISVSWFCKKVGDITNILPEHWIWKDTDKSKELKVEEPISADAVYNGTDKENYVTKTVTYTITRSKCEHKHTAGRYYSSPSCTSSGYSGDTYCTDCNETLSYGYTIPAYGHDYDNGVITTEPTAETDGIITYTCKRCKHQDTKTLGKLGDGEPYIEGSFQKKGWDAVNDLIKTSKEKDTISITLNGSRTLPASVLSGIKGKDISLNLDMENGFIWKINGTSITSETPADTDLSVTNTAEYIPAVLYSLISTNQNDFGFHLGRSGAFDFPAVLSVKADASCAGLMANLFWYDVENGVLQCIQTVTVGGAFERSIPYADFTLSKGQDYFIAFGTESLNGRAIHTDGSITDENGAYLRPANTKISSHSIDRNKLTVKLSKGCAGAQGYDFVISKKSNMLQTGKFSKTVSSTGKPQASFRYLAKGTWYVAARSWVLDAQGNKVYGSWTKIKKIKITVVTPQQPKIRNITVEGNTVTITYTKCKNATGYEILLGNKYKTSAGEKYPVKKYVKRTEGKNTVTVTFTIVKKGTWYVTVRSWNKTSKNKSRVYSPYSDIKKFKVKK